jgi:hypothetical protein
VIFVVTKKVKTTIIVPSFFVSVFGSGIGDPRYGIEDPRSSIRDPGSRMDKYQDPGSGIKYLRSATLAITGIFRKFYTYPPVLWIHKYCFRIRIPKSIILNYGATFGRSINYRSGQIPDPTWAFLWPRKKFAVK